MDQEQKNKWNKKLSKAKAMSEEDSTELSTGQTDNPDLNTIRKKYRQVTEDSSQNEQDIQLEPDSSLEEDIEVEVKNSKSIVTTDANHDNLTSKKIVIKSKSKGTLGFNG